MGKNKQNEDVQVEEEAVKAPAAAEVKKPSHVVAEGKAITATGKRILGAGAAVAAADLSGGKKAFDSFVKSGHIVKNK